MAPYEESKLILDEKDREWTDRSIYSQILRDIIISQERLYNHARDVAKKSKLAHSIAYLVQVQNSLINSEKNIEARIEKLEELAKLQ